MKRAAFAVLMLVAGAVAGLVNLDAQPGNLVGQEVGFEAVNAPGRFIRHRNWLGVMDPRTDDISRRDSTFRVVAGLAGRCVSLESQNHPNHFLRHQGSRLRLSPRAGDRLFLEDATFCIVPGLANPGAASFESVNYPGHFIRHRNFELWLDRFDGSDLFRRDATFEARRAGPDPSVVRPAPAAAAPVADVARTTVAFLYIMTLDERIVRYRHVARGNEPGVLEGPEAIPIARVGDFTDLLPAPPAGVIGVSRSGVLALLRDYRGKEDHFRDPIMIGNSYFSRFKLTIPVEDDVFYCVTAGGDPVWTRGVRIERRMQLIEPVDSNHRFAGFTRAFSGGGGVVYAWRGETRGFFWAKTSNWQTPNSEWAGPLNQGDVFLDATHAGSRGNGYIYYIQSNGQLMLIRHLGHASGREGFDRPVWISGPPLTNVRAFVVAAAF